MYEAKFLCGMIAGTLADNNRIGYIADYPIYGMTANINAFALGARMVNPRDVYKRQDYLLGRIDYPKIAPEFSNSLIQNVTIGDFVCRIDSFNSKSKRLLVDYVNYLTYMENTEKLKKDDKTKNPIQ